MPIKSNCKQVLPRPKDFNNKVSFYGVFLCKCPSNDTEPFLFKVFSC